MVCNSRVASFRYPVVILPFVNWHVFLLSGSSSFEWMNDEIQRRFSYELIQYHKGILDTPWATNIQIGFQVGNDKKIVDNEITAIISIEWSIQLRPAGTAYCSNYDFRLLTVHNVQSAICKVCLLTTCAYIIAAPPNCPHPHHSMLFDSVSWLFNLFPCPFKNFIEGNAEWKITGLKRDQLKLIQT